MCGAFKYRSAGSSFALSYYLWCGNAAARWEKRSSVVSGSDPAEMSESGSQEAQPRNGGGGGSPTKRAPIPAVGNRVTVVLGAQWGDEGKGKVVDLLAQDADMVCRCQVG